MESEGARRKVGSGKTKPCAASLQVNPNGFEMRLVGRVGSFHAFCQQICRNWLHFCEIGLSSSPILDTHMKIAYSFRLLALVCTFFAGGISMGVAQDEDFMPDTTSSSGGKKVSGGFGYFTPGYLMYSLEEFNEYFEPDAYAPVKDNGITLGGGGTLLVRNFLLGGEGHGVLSKKASSSLMNAELESGWGMFNIGYVVFARKSFLLYPKLGIGGYSHELTLKDQIAGTTMDTVTAGDYSGTMLSRKGMLGSAEINFDFIPTTQESSAGGLVFGLAVGYQMAFADKGWEAYGTKVSGGPNINPSGLFVRLHVGMGGWSLQD